MQRRRWIKFLTFMLGGYLMMGRSFAYLGVPPLKLFIGEIGLGAFILMQSRAIIGRWMLALRTNHPLSEISWGMAIFVFYGLFEVVRGVVLERNSPLAAVVNFAFNYYPLYFFLGLWLGINKPDFFKRFFHVYAWFNGIYGLLYISVLTKVPFTIPGSQVEMFGQATGSAVVLLGILTFERNLMKVWVPIMLNLMVMLGVQVRAEWLGFTLGTLVWAYLAKQLNKLLNVILVGFVILALGMITDIRFPSPAGRGGEIAVRELVARGVAPISTELASQLSPHAAFYMGTFQWRKMWWDEIWASIHSSTKLFWIGHGYGFQLSDLAYYLEHEPVRTPHNVFYYALGYGGWLGVFSFFIFQFTLVRLLWRTYCKTRQCYGLVYWVAAMAGAFFSNFFETPFGAIPFYLLTGLGSAPLFVRQAAVAPARVSTSEESLVSQPSTPSDLCMPQPFNRSPS